MGYLLDTNTIINYLEASIPSGGMQLLNTIVDNEPVISIITKMEMLGYNFKSIEEQTTMETFINCSSILDLSSDIVNKTIAKRKSKRMKLPDAIIAATALVYSLTLITRNAKDFRSIEGLDIINPFEI
jgi:predicted nucleic acid-binding protein